MLPFYDAQERFDDGDIFSAQQTLKYPKILQAIAQGSSVVGDPRLVEDDSKSQMYKI